MNDNHMGEFLAALRKSKGYTQQEIADILGVSNKTVSSWETGASCPDISMLPVLAELYGVTCDEIIRGRRMSAEAPSPAKREKAMEHLLQRQKANLFTVCWIAGGLAGAALLLTSLIGYAALESLIGFFVGLIFHAASIITAAICIRRLRFQTGEAWESEAALNFTLSLMRAMFWIVFANAAVFGFDLLHAFIPAHAGLSLDGENLLLQLLAAAGGALLAFLIGYSVLLHKEKKRLTAAEADGIKSAIAAASRKNALARFRMRRIPLTVLPFLLFAACAVCLLWAAGTVEDTVEMPQIEQFNMLAETGPEVSGPFAEADYTLVSEEQPSSANETGEYEVVWLFPDFPDEWRDYYHTEKTKEGTLVTVKKYRFASELTGEIVQFTAFDPDWQGGLHDFHADPIGETQGQMLYAITMRAEPTLMAQRQAQEAANRQDILSWLSLGFGALALLSFAVTVPLYVKRECKFKKTL